MKKINYTCFSDSSLMQLANLIPGYVFWKDLDGKFLGSNDAHLKALGLTNLSELIGKDDYVFYPDDVAETCRKYDKKAIKEKQIIKLGEEVRNKSGFEEIWVTSKAPLYNSEGELIGIIGVSLDITATKKSEILEKKQRLERAKAEEEKARLKAELAQKAIEESQKLADLAAQVAHDIRSPLTAMNIILKDLPQLPEEKRIILRNATNRINDIANNLLTRYRNKENETSNKLGSFLIEPIIETMVAEKRLSLEDKLIILETCINPKAYFSFAHLELQEFKRVLSNLINNAIEALPDNKGKIIVQLDTIGSDIIINIIDNGVGIPADKLPTLFEAKKTTKKEGSGIGLAHAKVAIENMNGKISISSIINQGTTLTITLPLTSSPAWFISQLDFSDTNTIAVVDDDESIHGAWDEKLKALNKKINIVHFRTGADFTHWYKTTENNTVFVLSDYELLGETKTGLDILEELGIQTAILITSHYENPDIIERCSARGIYLLPKNLVTHIPIIGYHQPIHHSTLITCDAILVDDDELIRASWIMQSKLKKKNTVTFASIKDAESEIDIYRRDTPIYIDSNLEDNIAGELYAKSLFEKGFTTIYLATGYQADSFKEMAWIKEIITKEQLLKLKYLL